MVVERTADRPSNTQKDHIDTGHDTEAAAWLSYDSRQSVAGLLRLQLG